MALLRKGLLNGNIFGTELTEVKVACRRSRAQKLASSVLGPSVMRPEGTWPLPCLCSQCAAATSPAARSSLDQSFRAITFSEAEISRFLVAGPLAIRVRVAEARRLHDRTMTGTDRAGRQQDKQSNSNYEGRASDRREPDFTELLRIRPPGQGSLGHCS